MSHFSLPRFIRVLQNDALRIASIYLGSTVVTLAVTIVMYRGAFSRAKPTDDPAHIVMFGAALICAGLVLTGLAFKDMHHPLQRNQYLMLPCSNFERLLTRYLLTGPLFALYGTLAFMAIDFVSNQLIGMWIQERQLAFSPRAPESLDVIKGYLVAHQFILIGAICFRSHALVKTILFLTLTLFCLFLAEYVARRILFPDNYSWTQFGSIRDFPVELQPYFTMQWLNVTVVVCFFAWLLCIAYLCLRDHEATDGV
jgi:uncharacterized membrane protein HdeD (DUF308 family)